MDDIKKDIAEIKEFLGYVYDFGCCTDITPKHISIRMSEILQSWKEEDEDDRD